MTDTIFDKIVRGEMQSRIVWQSDTHMAFLTPFPNTPGFTVVIPKTYLGDNVFSLEETDYIALMDATRTVAKLLEKALDVKRVALIFEGTGVAYVHGKLIPLYGDLADETNVWSSEKEFTEEYRGYITTLEGPKMDDARLDEIQAKIVNASK
jgi:diadenosine tetraphosphate (Ap4A) HIT family hydrolase